MCAAGARFAVTNATGTRASSQSMGLWRISLSRGSMFYLLRLPVEISIKNIDSFWDH